MIRHAFSTPFIVCVYIYVCFPGICLFMIGLNHASIKMLCDSHRAESDLLSKEVQSSFRGLAVLNYFNI